MANLYKGLSLIRIETSTNRHCARMRGPRCVYVGH